MSRLLNALVARATARPRLTVTLAVALGAAGAVLALALSPSAATDTFVGRQSATYRATQTFYHQFGEEPIEVLVQANLEKLLLGADLEKLVGLEGCLSGRVPTSPPAGKKGVSPLAAEGGPNGPCARLARLHAVDVVIGPGTFINEAAREIDEQLLATERQARAQAAQASHTVFGEALARGLSETEAHALAEEASKVTLSHYEAEVLALALRYGITSPPALGNPEFVDALVFDHSASAGTPKPRFAYLFPSPNAALISLRLRAGLSESRRAQAIALVRKVLAMPQWRLETGQRYLVTGEPVIVSDLTGTFTHAIEILLVAVVLVMAAALGLVFRGRPRLLPLGIALLASALTFGALALSGGTLTVGALAVLPVLVGLAVDYSVQLQARTEEALSEAPDAPLAVTRAAVLGAPTIAAAALACAGAMLGLLLSPVPLVQGFGVLLIVGIALAFLCALCVGSAVLVIWHAPAGPRRWARARAGRAAAGPGAPAQGSAAVAGVHAGPLRAVGRAAGLAGRGAASWLAASWRGASELVQAGPLPRALSRAALKGALRSPAAVLGVGLLLAVAGWAAATQTPVETDITKLVPQDLASLHSLNVLERESGVGGQVDVLLHGHDLTSPSVVAWMASYESTVLKRFGYRAPAAQTGAAASAAGTAAAQACARAALCPAFSLPDLFQGTAGGAEGAGRKGESGGGGSRGGQANRNAGHGSAGKAAPGHGSAGSAGAATLTRSEIDGLLAAIPPYLSHSVISADRRYATVAFGIRLMPLARQQHVIETMRAMLHPPKGVKAQLVGLAVLAAQADAQVSSVGHRALGLLVSLIIVVAVLLAAFRGDLRRTLATATPVVLASGWSGLVLFLTRVPLNPMSVTLSILVVAISTELSVLLAGRYRQERQAGYEPAAALARSYRRTGAAVAASAVTAIAGFAVLAVSQIRMLQEFGLVTIIDLAVALAGVLVALPAALLLFGEPRSQGLVRGPLGLGRPEWLPPTAASARLIARLRSRGRRAPA